MRKCLGKMRNPNLQRQYFKLSLKVEVTRMKKTTRKKKRLFIL